ncbi:hypothetical protein [Janthinobacterium sp. LB3P112]|uniref:hypothetical protein n=1 Tax=Janthinobacterium sp. LB3P112 TaxID=3424196 RepID=UPI003F1EFEA2
MGADPLGGELPVLKMAQQRASTPESKAVLALLKAAAAPPYKDQGKAAGLPLQ